MSAGKLSKAELAVVSFSQAATFKVSVFSVLMNLSLFQQEKKSSVRRVDEKKVTHIDGKKCIVDRSTRSAWSCIPNRYTTTIDSTSFDDH